MRTPFVEGIAALRAGDLSTAEHILLGIVERNPAAHEAWQALSVAAVRAGMPDIGIERAKRAVALDRRNPDYLHSLGVAYGENDEPAQAERAFRSALRLKPAYAEAHYNLARVLRLQGRLMEALAEYERAHALQPAALAIELGLVAMHSQLGRPDRALSVLRAAAGEMPDEGRIPSLANTIAEIEGSEAAVAWLRALLVRQADSAAAHFALAQFLLGLGHWREGWSEYLWRPRGDLARRGRRPAVFPSRLDGMRVVLRAEYGIGDVLFFLRFAGELRVRGAVIALECPPQWAKMAPLLVDYITIDKPTAGDWCISVADLPSLLETDATPPAFALPVDDDECARARQVLARLGPPPYLGLTWRAGTARPLLTDVGPAREVSLFKDISPALLGGVARGWPGTVVSLQRRPRRAELQSVSAAAGAAVHDLGEATEDLRAAIGLLSQLDEYVAVSNTNVHLLAGLGRSARVLVPEMPEWRWMLGQGGSVWFPGFNVYRQAMNLEWPLDRLREDLARRQSDRATSPTSGPARGAG